MIQNDERIYTWSKIADYFLIRPKKRRRPDLSPFLLDAGMSLLLFLSEQTDDERELSEKSSQRVPKAASSS